MSHNFQRPNLPYRGTSLQNDKRYQLATAQSRGMRDIAIDSDLNYLTDGLRQLDSDIGSVQAGILQGSDNPLNANSLVTTDGAGTISWIKVQDANVFPNSISGGDGGSLMPQTITSFNIMDGTIGSTQLSSNSVTTIKISNANVTLEKMAQDSVGTNNIIDANITLEKMAPNSVGTGNLVDGCITTLKIEDGCITTSKIADSNVTLNKLNQDVLNYINNIIPIGTIIEFPGSSVLPNNWLECNGQSVSRATYASLFAVINTIYGNVDGNTFNLPDKRGRVAVGIGSDNSTGGRITNATAPTLRLGGTFGAETHQLTVNQLASHSHQITTSTSLNQGNAISSNSLGQVLTANTLTTGGDEPHNNVQPSMFFKYYIRAL